MNKLPMDYLKILTFNEKYEAFKKYDDLYISNKLSDENFSKYFWALKSLLVFYCKNIKFHYKKLGKNILLPTDILEQAKKDSLISDADTWLEYTKEVNTSLNIADSNERYCSMKNILEKYRLKIDSMLEYMHSEEKNKLVNENHDLFKEISTLPLDLADNRPIYSHKELLISERSYKILLDYFISNKQIRRVWLHGSRMYGTSHPGSDLDLIIDCDITGQENINDNINKLLIPYFVDVKNICDKEALPFIKCAMHYGTKKIYENKDFQTFWGNEKSLKSVSINVKLGKLI